MHPPLGVEESEANLEHVAEQTEAWAFADQEWPLYS